jgi:Amt family ammonium transporter
LGTVLMPFLTFVGAGGVVLSRPVPAQFMVQLLGVVSVGIWSAIATFAIIKVTALVVGLRVDREHEIQGLDFISHGETGYNFD